MRHTILPRSDGVIVDHGPVVERPACGQDCAIDIFRSAARGRREHVAGRRIVDIEGGA